MKMKLGVRLQKAFPQEVMRAVFQEVEVETKEVKKGTPVRKGTLRGTVHQVGPKHEGQIISSTIVAGGPAAPYAFFVHENLDAIHKVGRAKYIEAVLQESRPHIARRVARRIDLNRVVKR